MASIRPSAFNQRERLDGGPFLVIEAAEPEEEGINVFFTDIPAAERKPDSPIARLLNVCPDRLTIWPLNLKFPRRQREFSCSINDLRWIAGLGF